MTAEHPGTFRPLRGRPFEWAKILTRIARVYPESIITHRSFHTEHYHKRRHRSKNSSFSFVLFFSQHRWCWCHCFLAFADSARLFSLLPIEGNYLDFATWKKFSLQWRPFLFTRWPLWWNQNFSVILLISQTDLLEKRLEKEALVPPKGPISLVLDGNALAFTHKKARLSSQFPIGLSFLLLLYSVSNVFDVQPSSSSFCSSLDKKAQARD